MTLEDRAESLSRNVGKELPFYVAYKVPEKARSPLFTGPHRTDRTDRTNRISFKGTNPDGIYPYPNRMMGSSGRTYIENDTENTLYDLSDSRDAYDAD